VSSLFAGSNRLLRSGAAALTAPADVLELYGIEALATRNAPDVSEAASRVLARLEQEPAGADALARALRMGASELAAALTELELAGAVSERDGCFRRSS
jgi:predicted Rossmann fold nucleotide-binding protein DprA/Smf involved in DNA uptake